MLWDDLYYQVRAIETIHGLNPRGRRILRYLEKRRRRYFRAIMQQY